MDADPTNEELQELLDQIGAASQFMADMDAMYAESIEYYLDRVQDMPGMDEMEGMEGMEGMDDSDDDMD